jgi:hypothetical protein
MLGGAVSAPPSISFGGMPGRTTRPRRPARSRELTRFLAATLLSIDFLLTGFTVWNLRSSVRIGLVSFLEVWDIGKGVLAMLGLAWVAFRTRSTSLAVFAAILGVITLLEGTGTHGALADWILDRFAVSGPAGVSPRAFVEILVLSTFAVLAVIAIWSSRTRERDLSLMRRHLSLLLVALWVFAVVLDYVAAITASGTWRLVEEGGERAVMSILLAYVLGSRLGRQPTRPSERRNPLP